MFILGNQGKANVLAVFKKGRESLRSIVKRVGRLLTLGIAVVLALGFLPSLNPSNLGWDSPIAVAGEKGEVGLEVTVISMDSQSLVFTYDGKKYSTPASPAMAKGLDLKPGKTLILWMDDSAVSDFLKSELKP